MTPHASRLLARLVLRYLGGDREALSELRRVAPLYPREWAALAIDDRTRAAVGLRA